jgi:hypothetical protein
LIAAVLSGDQNLLRDYLDGDPYTNCAVRMGLAPKGSTKETIGPLRDVMKVWLLSTLYGASPKSLHDNLPDSTLQQAEEFVRQNRISYTRYWQWSTGASKFSCTRPVLRARCTAGCIIWIHRNERMIIFFPLRETGLETFRCRQRAPKFCAWLVCLGPTTELRSMRPSMMRF